MQYASNETAFTNRRSGLKKVLWIIVLLFVLILGGFFYWKYFFTYSSGNRYGLLQKFSHKGNLFKTYEGELILSSIKGNNNVALASEKFFFSVTNEKVAGQLMNLQGHFVTVHYKEKKSAVWWRGDTPYIVDSVKAE